MIEIKGMMITKAEIVRDKNVIPKGLGIHMNIEDVELEGELIQIRFTYIADYTEDVAKLTISGVMSVKEEKKLRDKILKVWKDKKKLEDEFAEEVLNNINFACGAHGTLIARVVNLQPPMMPPRIRLDKEGASASAA